MNVRTWKNLKHKKNKADEFNLKYCMAHHKIYAMDESTQTR